MHFPFSFFPCISSTLWANFHVSQKSHKWLFLKDYGILELEKTLCLSSQVLLLPLRSLIWPYFCSSRKHFKTKAAKFCSLCCTKLHSHIGLIKEKIQIVKVLASLIFLHWSHACTGFQCAEHMVTAISSSIDFAATYFKEKRCFQKKKSNTNIYIAMYVTKRLSLTLDSILKK